MVRVRDARNAFTYLHTYLNSAFASRTEEYS